MTQPTWIGSGPTGTVIDRLSLGGKSAIVTGGSRGIGRAIAHGLAEAGANVAILSRRSRDEGTAVAEQLIRLGVDSYADLADVTSRSSLDEALRRGRRKAP